MRVLAIAAVLFAVAVQAVLAGPARAHATLVSSEPADGAVIPAAPSRLTLTFNEPVSPLVLRLVAPDSSSSLVQAVTERETSLAIALPSGLRDGTHVLSWRVVSLDGHPIGGTVVFSIGAPSAGPGPSAQSSAQPAVTAALWVFKVVFYVGLFAGAGGSFFLAWLAGGSRGGGRTTITAFLLAGLVATPVLVGLQGTDALELPLSGLADRTAWATGFGTSFGATAIAAACALLAGLAALQTRGARALSLFAVGATGLALALSGHASSAAPQWLTRPAVLVHAISVAIWIGALAPLAAAMLREPAPEAVLARFSRAIPWAVAALVVSGAILAVVQVAQPGALVTTAYGLLLSAKLGLVAALLAVAGWNRFRLTAEVIAGSMKPRRMLVRLIGVEIAIVVAILGLVAAWRFTPPPRALVIASAKPALVHIHTAAAMADVTFEPARAGMVQASIVIMRGDFGGLDAREVRLTLDNKSADIEAISRPATKGSDNIWRIPQLPIPTGGRWKMQVEILISDFEKVTLEDQVDIRNR
jgi:copper transport protein